MKILQLTSKFPHPLKDGASWAVQSLAHSLRDQGCSLDLFSLNTQNHFADSSSIKSLDQSGLYKNIYTSAHVVPSTYWSGLINLFSRLPVHHDRLQNKKATEELIRVVTSEDYDFLLLESPYLYKYAQAVKEVTPKLKVVLRTHNVEQVIWERLNLRKRGLTRWYLKGQVERLKNYEREVLQSCDGYLTMSDRDRKYFEKSYKDLPPSIVCPIGFKNTGKIRREIEDRPLILGFIGSLDWRPNLEGLSWFFKEIWPEIQLQDYNSVLMVAGRNPKSTRLWRDQDNVTFMGEIDDSATFLSRVDLCIVPLLSGSGTRVKILQALSLGTPVIATSIGAEGLNVESGKNILIGDDVSNWTSWIERFVTDEQLRIQLGENGQEYLRAYHDPAEIGNQVVAFLSSL